MSYGAAFGLSAAMNEEKEWRKNSGRIVSRSGGGRRRGGEGSGGGGGKKESWDEARARMRKDEAERRWRMGSGPKPEHVAEREHRDKTRALDIQERESGLADARQGREYRANAEQRAQQTHQGSLADAGRRRRREDVADRMQRYEAEIADLLHPTKLKLAEADRDRRLTQAQTELHREAFGVLELRGPDAFAKTLNAMSTNGINDAASAVWEDGPKGRRLRVVDKQGGTVLDESGAPVIFSEAAIQKLTGTAGNWSIKDGYAIEKGSGQVRELDPGAGYRTAFLRTAQESAGNGYGQKPEDVVATARAVADAAYGRAPAQSGPPRVTSQADYAALPSGTQFIDPEGNLRVKP